MFINILDLASKVVFCAIIFQNLLFFPARVNKNLSQKWFVIVIFVDFGSFNFMKYKFSVYIKMYYGMRLYNTLYYAK